jgi:hypothetical protein
MKYILISILIFEIILCVFMTFSKVLKFYLFIHYLHIYTLYVLALVFV